MGVSTFPGRIIAEPSKDTSLRPDRLSHFGSRISLFILMLVLRGVCSIPANPVSTGVCYEQNSNYLSGTRAASRPVFPSGRSRWFPLLQRTGRPSPGHLQVGRGGIVAETERVFQNLSAVLKAAGKSFDDV